MASIAGTSGSSGGGGNQPPNEPSTMGTKTSSNPESSKNLLQSNQFVSRSIFIAMKEDQTQSPKCSDCREYPRNNVYGCGSGHKICAECLAKRTHCPVCNAKYRPQKIRDFTAEKALENMTYSCSFRKYGCLETNILRNLRTTHEIQCEHNPSPNGFTFCRFFETSSDCQFRICPVPIMQDSQHRNGLVQHMTSPPHNLHYKKIKLAEKISFRVPLPNSVYPPFLPRALFEVYKGKKHPITIGYYVLIQRVALPGLEDTSWTVVGLNSAPENLNGGHHFSPKITVRFSIQAKANQNNVARFGDAKSVSNMSWTTHSTYLNEWTEFMMTPIEQRPPFSFLTPLALLSNHYVEQNDMFEMIVCFGPVAK